MYWERTKRIVSMVLCLAMLLGNFPVVSFAAERDGLCEHHTEHLECGYVEGESACGFECEICAKAEEETAEPAISAETVYTVTSQTAAPDIGLPDNEELFTYFAERELYGYDMATYGTAARENLNAIEQAIYDALKAQIETVAVSGGSTVFAISGISNLKTTWTNEELGVTSIDDSAAVDAAFAGQFSMDNIVTALLNDCPFDLYWYDKTVGVEMNYQVGVSGYNDGTQDIWNSAAVTDLTFTFAVSADYKSDDHAVTTDVAKIATAKNNAAQVVADNAGKSDYEKLVAYKNYICAAVSYNQSAADDNTTAYGNPWQLIYVFDGDISTNVVCEGYAKAFQYLCDLGGLSCISVSGTMTGATGAGGHMWNVVTLDGSKYLVDVTNNDDGTVGSDGSLFMVGCAYTEGKYTFTCNGQTVTFTCSNLGLAETNYGASTSATVVASGKCGDNLTWVLDTNGLLTISGEGAMDDYDFYNQSSTRAPWTEYANQIKTIIVENGVTIVGEDAFCYCDELNSIVLEDSVLSLGDFSIYGCDTLESITIGKGLSNIGNQVLDCCDGLKEVVIDPENPYFCSDEFGVIFNKTETAVLRAPTGLSGEYIIPDGVVCIGKGAFMHCEKLTEIVIPNGVESIDGDAFVGCWGLDSITIPYGVTTIGEYAFSGCEFTTVVIPQTVESLARYQFFNCDNIKDVYYGGTVAAWKVLGGSIPAADYVHYSCTDVLNHWKTETIDIPCAEDGYTRDMCSCGYIRNESSVPEHVYDQQVVDEQYLKSSATCSATAVYYKSCACGKMGETTFTAGGPNAYGHLFIEGECVRCDAKGGSCGDSLFWSLDKNGKLTIYGTGPMPINSINNRVPWYEQKDSIAEVVIESGVTTIGSGAFQSCGNLTRITLHEKITSIGFSAFAGCNSLANILIPNSVSNIGDAAFESCISLTSMTIPTGITEIGSNMFAGCSNLISVSIPESVTTIGSSAFGGCSKLSSIAIPRGVTSVGYYAFYNCISLTNIAIPSGVTGIDKYTFMGCTGLSTITIPSGVTSIGDLAFANCSALTDVYYDGTVEKWITFDNRPVGENLRVHYECTNSESHWAPKIVDATCTEDGYTAEVCKCATPYERNKVVKPATSEHIFAEIVKAEYLVSAATCSNRAEYYKSCSACGGKSTETFKQGELDANNHTGITHIENAKEATCTEEGYTGDTVCECGTTILNGTTIAVSDHNRDENHKCTVCGHISGYCGDPDDNGGKNVDWMLEEETGTLTISGTGAMADYAFQSYAPWYNSRASVKMVTIGNGVTTVGDFAFEDSKNLMSVTIPNSVTSIGDCAFEGCRNLTCISIPDSVTSIGEAAVSHCSSLTSFIIPDGVTSISSWTFYGCNNLTSITIPDSVTGIGNSAFSDCSSLTRIVIPDSVSSIGDCAFHDCTNLMHISIPDGVPRIGLEAFAGCVSLKEITIPASVTSIGKCAFIGCDNLVSIRFSGDAPIFELERLGVFEYVTATVYYPRTGNGWTEEVMRQYGGTIDWRVYCPDDVHSFEEIIKDEYLASVATCINRAEYYKSCECGEKGAETFAYGEPSNHTRDSNHKCTVCGHIGGYCVDWEGNETGVEWKLDQNGTLTISGQGQMGDYDTDWIDDTYTEWKTDAPWFYYRDMIVSLVIEAGVKSIGENAFYGCNKLESVQIAEGIEKISFRAFMDCTSLREIVIPNSVTVLGTAVFSRCTSLTKVTLPKGITSLSGNLFSECSNLIDVDIPDTVTQIGSSAFWGCSNLEEITIPDSVIQIGGHAFSQCVSLKNIAIPDGVTEITARTFYGCSSLKTVVLPNSVVKFGEGPFCGCSSLESINIPEGVTSLPWDMFAGCSSLTDIAIPSSVRSIGESAFSGCTGLTSIVIPENVSSVGIWVFNNCTNLKKIWFKGNAPSFHSSFKNVTATAYYPAGNTTWTEDVLQDYGGTITWVPYCYEGHKYASVVTPPDCEEKGYTTHTCAVCGDVQVDSYTDAMGHDMGEWTVVTEPVPGADGEERRDCGYCDYFETRATQYQGNILKLEGEDLLSQSVVYINGLPYAVKGEGENRYVELPVEGDFHMVTYTYHVGDANDVHTQYPSGMKAYKVEDGKITYIPELDNILQYSGSSIRITGKKGIRMITSLTKTAKSALTGKGLAGYKLLEYGTTLCFASEIPEGDALVLGKPYARSNFAYKKGVADPVFATTKDLMQYTNVLVGFSLDQCKDDIAMRPYIVLEDANGEQVTLYGGTIYRSIGYIAYQNRSVFKPKTASYNYVWEIIHHVYGDKYDADYKG